MVIDYGQNYPRGVKRRTIREFEYDSQGRVVKETITIEEYNDMQWHPVTWTVTNYNR